MASENKLERMNGNGRKGFTVLDRVGVKKKEQRKKNISKKMRVNEMQITKTVWRLYT